MGTALYPRFNTAAASAAAVKCHRMSRRPLDYQSPPPPDPADDEPLWRNLLGRLGLFLIGTIPCGLGVLPLVTAYLPLVILGGVLVLVGLMFAAAALLPRRWTEPVADALGGVGTFLARLLDGWMLWW